MKFIAAIIFAVSSLAHAGNNKVTYPTTEDYGVMFNSASNIETFLYLDMVGTEGKSKLESAFKKYGLTKDYQLPKAKMDGKFLVFEGLPKKFDFSKLHDGQISDGKNTMRFDAKASEEQQIDQFVEFVTGKKVAQLQRKSIAASMCTPLLPCANAFDPNEAAEKVYAMALAAAGVGVGARGLVQLMKYIKAANAGASVAMIAPAGRALVMLLAADSLIRAGYRIGTGDSVECKGDKLFLKKARGGTVNLNDRGETFLASIFDVFSHSKIGVVELVARRAYCSNKEAAQDLLNGLMSMGSSDGKPAQPAGSTR